MTTIYRFLIQCLGLFLCCLVSISSSAAMYKWSDANGQTHYTQTPPPAGVEGAIIKMHTLDSSNSDVANEKLKELEEGFKTRRENRQQHIEDQRQAKAQQKEQEENCKTAQEYLANARAQNLFVQVEGIPRRLVDDELVKAVATAQENIKRYCN